MASFKIEPGTNELPKAVIKTANSEAHVYLHGAHVTHFQQNGQKPLLFMSQSSWFEPGKPIRGGVPICWPWFGPKADDASAPAHGLARLHAWSIEGFESHADGRATLQLSLADNPSTRQIWPHAFGLRFAITVGDSLEMSLTVTNRSPSPFRFEEALHTYFAVGDVRKASITGLENARYTSKVEHVEDKMQAGAIAIIEETDRVYMDTGSTVFIEDDSWKRKIAIEKSGSASTVVWNPWIKKSVAMPDFGDGEWPNMLCIETANARRNAVELAPGQSHRMVATIRQT